MRLSVAIIAFNEEDRLGACLKGLSFADEVLVVDSGSQDRTVTIAESFGCRVLVEAWRGYAGQKQFAVDHCQHDWVLILDADEQVPMGSGSEIKDVLSRQEPKPAAYSLLRKNYFHDRWITRCGWWPDRLVRLVDRTKGRFDSHRVHEKWIAQGPVQHLNIAIQHTSFRNYSDLIKKMQDYSTLAAQDLFIKGKRVSWWTPSARGLWMLFRTYILERGFLEGFDGWVISLLNAGGSFLKYAKAREMHLHHDTARVQPLTKNDCCRNMSSGLR